MKNALKEARFKLNITQYKLAVLSNIPQSRISLIENQYVEPTKLEMKKLAKALGKNIKELFYIEEAENKTN